MKAKAKRDSSPVGVIDDRSRPSKGRIHFNSQRPLYSSNVISLF